MEKDALILILGRAGSRGVPNKNLAALADRECVRWTIDAAQQADCAGRIALSSDSEQMCRIALETGIDAVIRPAHLASDDARVDDAARHAVESLDALVSELIVILYANVPVRPEGLIDHAVSLLRESGADSVQSYAPVGKHHPWWTARVDPDGASVRPWEGERMNHGVYRRQDLPPAYVPDGGVIAVRRSALFLEQAGPDTDSPHAFLGADWRGVINEEGAVIDIDSRLDLLVADAVLRERERARALGDMHE